MIRRIINNEILFKSIVRICGKLIRFVFSMNNIKPLTVIKAQITGRSARNIFLFNLDFCFPAKNFEYIIITKNAGIITAVVATIKPKIPPFTDPI